MEIALEAGADDVVTENDGSIEVVTTPEVFTDVVTAMEEGGLTPANSEVTMRASLEVELDLEADLPGLGEFEERRPFEDDLGLDHALEVVLVDDEVDVLPALEGLVVERGHDGELVAAVGELVGERGPGVPVALGAHGHVHEDLGSEGGAGA